MTIQRTRHGIPFWDPSGAAEDLQGLLADPWDVVNIAGERFRGVAEVSATLKLRTEKKKSPGRGGSTTTIHGWDSADVTIELTLWTEQHLQSWEKIKGVIHPSASKGAPKPVDVYHPCLEDLEISKVIILEISALKKDTTHGVKKVTLKCGQFDGSFRIAGQSSVSTPKSSIGSIESRGPGAVQRAIDEAKRPSVTQAVPSPRKGAGG